MENIQWLTDNAIQKNIGQKIKEWRLEINMTQTELAEKARLSLATVQSAEYGRNISVENLIRILRILDRLESLNPFMEEKQISPIEYMEIQRRNKQRKRASKKAYDHDKNTDGQPVW